MDSPSIGASRDLSARGKGIGPHATNHWRKTHSTTPTTTRLTSDNLDTMPDLEDIDEPLTEEPFDGTCDDYAWEPESEGEDGQELEGKEEAEKI